MTSKAKSKGNSAEREICEKMETIFGGKWIRTPSSGAFIGKSNTYRKQAMDHKQICSFKGDVIPPESFSKLVIESKFYANFPFHRLLINEPIPLLEEWLYQTYCVCDIDDFPLLITKFNRKGSFVFVKESDISSWNLTQNRCFYRYHKGNENIVGMDFHLFVETYKEQIKQKML